MLSDLSVVDDSKGGICAPMSQGDGWMAMSQPGSHEGVGRAAPQWQICFCCRLGTTETGKGGDVLLLVWLGRGLLEIKDESIRKE